jgi:hypothetical protein
MLTKFAEILLVLSIVVCAAKAQQPCKISIADSPSISGLKLGMPIAELTSVIGPGIKFKPTKTGEGVFFQNFIEQTPPPKLTGTRTMYVRYFNGKVYQIEIFFEDKDQPSKLEEFTTRLSTYYELPRDAWKVKNDRAELDCGSFRVNADAILNRHIELTDDAAYKDFQTKQQRKKKPSKKRN